MIVARAGHKKSLDRVKDGFLHGFITKDKYAQTLRAYQKRVDEMTSVAREEAKTCNNLGVCVCNKAS